MDQFGEIRTDDLDALMRHSQEQLGRISELQERLREVVGTAASEDGTVEVSFGHDGQLRDLTLNPRAMRRDSATLAETLTQVIRAAHNDLHEKISALTIAMLGESPMDYLNNPAAVEERLRDVQAGFRRSMDDIMNDLGRVRNRFNL